MPPGRPILVTGSHRSGTTWVGQMLSGDCSVTYLREPFSVLHRPGLLNVRFPYWFPYVCRENESAYLDPVRDLLRFRYRLGAGLTAVRTPIDAGKLVNDLRKFGRAKRTGARPLLKDPIALFSSEWLADRFGADVVVMIRHPAAFVSSLKRYGWTHPFDHFLAQPLLMRDILAAFEAEIRDFARTERDPMDQAILLWKLIYHAVAGYRDRHPTWLFFRHEDVALDPLGAFATIYANLGLEFGPKARALVISHTDPSNPGEATDVGTLKRDSRAVVQTWKHRLTLEEIDRVRSEVEPISKEFYADDDW